MNLTSLPKEAIRNIALHLKSPLNLLLTCKQFLFLVEDKLYWREKFRIDFPGDQTQFPNLLNNPKSVWKYEKKKYTTSSLKRIAKEIQLMKERTCECYAFPIEHNKFHWEGVIFGPEGSPYEGGTFNVDIVIPFDYPFFPPSVHFITKIYHPNVSFKGSASLDILSDSWTPQLTIMQVLISLTKMLQFPSCSEYSFLDVGNVLQKDKSLFERTAREWTINYAMRNNSINS